MRIPDHIIEQIRSQANIVDVVGEYVQLKKAGRNYLGLCPFHKEKTPSFNVNAERGMYKCFGCGKGGNAITFVQEHLHMTFPDAVKHLATKMGIPIPEEEVEDPTGMTARRDAARAALREAADFYRKTLSASDGAPVRTFYERRGFSADIQERFGLGAAPAAWDHLLTHLEANGFTRQHLEDAGLIIVKDDGKVYDRFRGRAMFTIRDDSGRVVGFSARTLSNDPDTPKYINSPQSMVFDKSRVLYGLDLAKRSIIEHKTVHVVEGQADVIAMHQGGFLSTVASSGTALTPDHVKLLKKYADTMVLVFDADSAGQKAMSRGIEIGLAGGMEVRCVVLPSGEDPDSMIKKNGVTAMSDLLAQAMPWMTYQTERFKKEGALSDP
ncbi:MAG: DNA primase, partial [Ignavibacteriae bacterium]